MALAVADDWDAPLGHDAEPARNPDDFKRDRRGSPYVSDPAGATVKAGKRKGEVCWVRYGRPSSFGKDIENTYNLDRWNERQIALGVARAAYRLETDDMDPELAERLAQVIQSDHDTDEERDALDGVIVFAKRYAKAGLAAERGTHMHAVTEDDDTEQDWVRRAEDGEYLGIPAEVQAAMVEAWRLTAVAYELETLAVEQKVVHDGWHLAGTLDRIVRLGRDVTFANGVTIPAGEKVLLDVKTGKLKRTPSGVIQYWHSYAVQCAAYADSRPYDTHTETREAWTFDDDFEAPESAHQINQQWAIIAHLPVNEALAGTAVCRLVLVDIAAARKVVKEVLLPARQWNARTDLFALCHTDEPCVEVPVEGLAPVDDGLAEQLEESVAIVEWIRPKVDDEGGPLTDEQRQVIRDRVGELTDGAKALLDSLAKEANRADHPFSIGAGPNRRRWHIYRALLRLGLHYGDDLDEDFIRATLALVLPDAQQPGVFLGAAIGSLTLDEAQRFVEATRAVLATDPPLHIDDDGRPTWVGVALPAA